MRPKNGFTLVEILIVVIILGILAAVVLPKFSNATEATRASMLKDNLRIMRMQISVFQGQHWGIAPGYPDLDPSAAPDSDVFTAHMTMASTVAGETADPGTDGYPYGPYLRIIAPNPVNGKDSIQMIANDAEYPAAADDSHGYIFQPSSLLLKADCTGNDEAGVSYFEY